MDRPRRSSRPRQDRSEKMSNIKGRFRWGGSSLIALATVINYIDRNALAVMWPEVSKEIGATKEDYALLVTIFMIFYAFGQSLFGRIFDAIGTRMGFTLSIVVWSLSIAAHALVRSMPLLMVLRATLGVSERSEEGRGGKECCQYVQVSVVAVSLKQKT